MRTGFLASRISTRTRAGFVTGVAGSSGEVPSAPCGSRSVWRVGVAAETVVSIVLSDVRQDAGAHRTPFRAPIPEPFRRISAARVAVVTSVLLQKGELATAVWTGKTGHAIPWRLGGSNKAFSMIPKNEILFARIRSRTAQNAFTATSHRLDAPP